MTAAVDDIDLRTCQVINLQGYGVRNYFKENISLFFWDIGFIDDGGERSLPARRLKGFLVRPSFL